jgi:hypothetical protein
MRREVVSDHLTILHHESNALQLGDVGDWISGHSDQISKFSWFNRADACPEYASTPNFVEFPSFGAAVQTRNSTYPLASIGQLVRTVSTLRQAP